MNSNESNNNYQTTTTSENNIKKPIEVDQVGFSTLPEQVHRKSLKKGFEFTLLVVGDSGLGKSTLVNSLFMTDLYSERVLDDVTDKINKTISITSRTAELEEKGVRLKLTVVDTPGFGDSVNSNDSWKSISSYIDEQFNVYYQHESGYGQERKKLQDSRIHCCLYFIPPHVRGLRPIDVETIRCLQTRVNIVPVIAKADSLTKKELDTLKHNVLSDIEKFSLKIYEFPVCDSDDDENFKKLDEEIKNAIPFGIIGSNTILESGNKRVRGRVYPWGIIDIESNCCDFTKLRTFLCSSHMQDLKDLTHDVHYENYRTEFIRTHTHKTPDKKSNTSSSNFMSNEEADKLLQQKDQELKKMQELVAKMKMNLNSHLTNNNVNGNGNFSNNNGHYHNQQQQQQQQQTISTTPTNMSSFGRNNMSNNHYPSANPTNTTNTSTSPISPSFPASNFSLVNRNISTAAAINAFNHESPMNHHQQHHHPHHHHHHHHRHLANANNFINSTPI